MSEIENLKIYGGATYTVGNENIIANEWEAGKTYVKGKSYVIREHRLYVCNVTHTSVEPFDPDNWTEITVGDAIAGNTTAIGSLSTLTTTDKSSLVGAVNEVVSDKADKAVNVTVSVATGVSLIHNSSVAVDKLVACNFAVEKTGGWSNGWQVAGTVSKIPSTNVSAPLWNITNGVAMGMVRIDAPTGNINLYIPTAANVRAEINICYST